MVLKMFPRRQSESAAPDGVRLYAIGDIHGRLDLLDALMEAIEKDAKKAGRSQLIFLGDYVDRGPDSCGVVDRLLEIRAELPKTIFLKGNHEAALLEFLDAPESIDDWLYWGGAETLESYGIDSPFKKSARELAAELSENLPENHLEFYQSLDLYSVLGDYLFVHAGLRPGVTLEEQAEDDLLWIRDDFHSTPPEMRPDQVVVHGHQPVKKPLDDGWRIDVDTGAVWTGRLTAIVLEGSSRRFLST